MNAGLAATLVPVFVPIGLGYTWKKFNRPFDTALVMNLVMALGAPCLIIATLSREQLQASSLFIMGLATACALSCFGVIGLLLLRVAHLPNRTYLPPLMFGNTGNLGLAVCLFAFGNEGLSFAIIFYVLSSMTLFTLGVWLWSGRPGIQGLLKTPLIYAVGFSLLLLLTGWKLPFWLNRSVTLIGQITIPLMLITLGVSLCDLKISNVQRVIGISALRLALGLVVGLLVSYLLQIRGTARGVLLLQCMTPIAVFNYLFSSRYNKHPEEVAGLVFVSTLLFLLVLPGILFYV